MATEKPENIDQYKRWLNNEHGVKISSRTRVHYDSVANKIKRDFETCSFWLGLVKNLREYNAQYLLRTGYPLLASEAAPELLVKSFDSFLSKTFRKNILDNNSWPADPEGGWLLPQNWYGRINDIVRTLFVVKYLDGVEFLKDRVESLCQQNGAECRISMEAREEGYYAAHLYTTKTFEIPRPSWDTEKINVSIEMQITTQLQEVIRKLLHKYYETSRQALGEASVKWQWDYKSDEFAANYLGHILHYVEGMIVDIREKQKKDVK